MDARQPRRDELKFILSKSHQLTRKWPIRSAHPYQIITRSAQSLHRATFYNFVTARRTRARADDPRVGTKTLRSDRVVVYFYMLVYLLATRTIESKRHCVMMISRIIQSAATGVAMKHLDSIGRRDAARAFDARDDRSCAIK